MSGDFSSNPILNTPYEEPKWHWQLDNKHQPTGWTVEGRRPSIHLVPIPEAQQQRRETATQGELVLEETARENPVINKIRKLVGGWRARPEANWGVTHTTQKLLKHWREGYTTPRPFFCQIEAAETLIWLNEVAPNLAEGKRILAELEEANQEANPELLRLASKMATGAGKTTVMAMMIAYHTLNKARQPNSKRFASHFLIITPGITIRDRLRVLLPSDPDNYYVRSGIVPAEYQDDIQRAQIVITNYHALKHRETIKMSSQARAVLKGHADTDISSLESDGQMLARVCKPLLNAKSVLVINDEAHHCYRHRTLPDRGRVSKEDKENNEAARLWISGIEALAKKVKLRAVYDLSATPFFLRGSGYSEGELFGWVVSDFALLDAIECGIVKLPRVPIDDGTDSEDKLPIYRNIYRHVARDLPKMGRDKQGKMNPDDLPVTLQGALQTLYSHYEKTHQAWQEAEIPVPPVFIIVCNNTSTSKLIFDFVSGYELENGRWKKGAFSLFSNVGADEKPLSNLRTLLIDSPQLESGEQMSDEFKKLAAPQIEQFKKEQRQRQQGRDSKNPSDEQLLREVMNTVGKKGKLGEHLHCVVSVSMLTEGWDTNNVTHILGVRAFGTQLLCEQVVGRGLRRYSYETEEDGKFAPEYADVFGVPFTFATGTKQTNPIPPPPQYRVQALAERAHLAISFPRVRSYTVKYPEERLTASFTENSRLTIKPEDAPPKTEMGGIVGDSEMLTLDALKKQRLNEVIFKVAGATAKLMSAQNGGISPSFFRDLVQITRRWIQDYLTCLGGTFPQYLLWQVNTGKAAERIAIACIPSQEGEEIIMPVVDKFTPEGSSFFVDYQTRKKRRFETSPEKCHVNLAVCDSDWEMSFCEFLEAEQAVFSYIRNDRLGFEIPYIYQKNPHIYLPDYIVLVDDGRGQGDLLNLIVEIKGERDDRDRVKADTAARKWVPAVNNDGRWGRWAFAEITNMQTARETLADIARPRPAKKPGRRRA